MVKSPWQQRIGRAEHLAEQHAFAAETLAFYGRVAKFQESLYQRLENKVPTDSRGGTGSFSVPLAVSENAAAGSELVASLPSFFDLLEKDAPAALAEVARGLRNSNSHTDLLNRSWTNIDSPASPAEFIVLAFLQPYAELLRARSSLHLESYTASLCPFCNRKPALGTLRQLGDAGKRNLVCGFCLAEWEFRRVVCPGCGQEDHAKLPVYTAESFPYIRVECCDTCQTYIKSIDLTKNGLAVPLVDELASIPLNLWAQERGYGKLQLNLLGM